MDTDVLLDDALDRYPHSVDSKEFLTRVEQTPGSAFIAWHTVSNVYYLIARRFIRRLLGFVQIAETTTGHLNYAVELDMSDFEDAMQAAAAQACGAEHIVTRNIRDYVGSAYQPLHLGKR